jgi:hypothetical protein
MEKARDQMIKIGNAGSKSPVRKRGYGGSYTTPSCVDFM